MWAWKTTIVVSSHKGINPPTNILLNTPNQYLYTNEWGIVVDNVMLYLIFESIIIDKAHQITLFELFCPEFSRVIFYKILLPNNHSATPASYFHTNPCYVLYKWFGFLSYFPLEKMNWTCTLWKLCTMIASRKNPAMPCLFLTDLE